MKLSLTTVKKSQMKKKFDMNNDDNGISKNDIIHEIK